MPARSLFHGGGSGMDEGSMLRMLREVLSSRSNVDLSDALPRGGSPILDAAGEQLPPQAFGPGGGLPETGHSAAELRPEGQRYAYDQAMSGYNENMDSMYGGGPDEYEMSEPGLRAAEDAEDAARARPYRPNSEESNELYEPGLAEMEASWNDGMSDSDRYLYGPKGWDDPPPEGYDPEAANDRFQSGLEEAPDVDLNPNAWGDSADSYDPEAANDRFQSSLEEGPADEDAGMPYNSGNSQMTFDQPGGMPPPEQQELGLGGTEPGVRDQRSFLGEDPRGEFQDTRNAVTRPNQFAQESLTPHDLPPAVVAWVKGLDPQVQEVIVAALMRGKR